MVCGFLLKVTQIPEPELFTRNLLTLVVSQSHIENFIPLHTWRKKGLSSLPVSIPRRVPSNGSLSSESYSKPGHVTLKSRDLTVITEDQSSTSSLGVPGEHMQSYKAAVTVFLWETLPQPGWGDSKKTSGCWVSKAFSERPWLKGESMGMRHQVKHACSIRLNWSQETTRSKWGHRQRCQDLSYHDKLIEQHVSSLTRGPSEQLSTEMPIRPEDQLYIVSGAHQAELSSSLQHWGMPVS